MFTGEFAKRRLSRMLAALLAVGVLSAGVWGGSLVASAEAPSCPPEATLAGLPPAEGQSEEEGDEPACPDVEQGGTSSDPTTTTAEPGDPESPPEPQDPAPEQPQAPEPEPQPADPPEAAPSEPAVSQQQAASARPAEPAAQPQPAPAPVVTQPQPEQSQSAPRRVRRPRRPDPASVPRSLMVRPSVETASGPPQFFFPPVSVDWAAISPLAPPQFGADEAAQYPGPAFLLPIFEAASAQYNVSWQILAAINEAETNWGRNTGPSSAGAVGWMQFMPATWAQWGVDANGDGVKNPHDPVDAIFAAARYLKAAGSTRDMGAAVWAYNHAGWYVEKIISRALEFARIPTDLLASLSAQGRRDAEAIRRATGATGYLDSGFRARTIGQVMLLDDRALQRRVLDDERIEIYECGREDVEGGVIDRRVLSTLAFLVHRKLHPRVSSLRCGHGYYTKSGNVSDHSHGGAIDIVAINGEQILGGQGPGSVTDETIRKLLRLQGGMRPHQIISLMTFQGAPNTLALGDHADHIHVGFAPLREVTEEEQ